MTEEHDRFIEDVAAHALGALEGHDRERVEAHVADCAICARHLEEYRAVAGALPIGLEVVAPPPEAWEAIRKAARQRRPHTPGWRKTAAAPGWLRAARWPVVAALVASLLVWNVLLQREVTRHGAGPQVEALARRPGRMVILAGTGTPGASARLFIAADGGHGHLAISGLDPLPPRRTYQLWFDRGAAPAVSGGVFRVDARGRAWATIDAPVSLDEVRAIVVTEEPAPGSATPGSRHLLEARSWR